MGTAALPFPLQFPRPSLGITEGFSDTALGGGMAASIFSGRSLGYLVVGLLAFALGVCVTVLCIRLRGHEGDSADEERYDD